MAAVVTYLTGDGLPLTPSDRCPFCRELSLWEDLTTTDKRPILWCACCDAVVAVGDTPTG